MGKFNIGQIMQLIEQGSALIEQLKPLLEKATSRKVQADYGAFTQIVKKLDADITALKEKLGDGKIDNDDALAALVVADDVQKIAQGIETLGSNFGTDLNNLKARFKIL